MRTILRLTTVFAVVGMLSPHVPGAEYDLVILEAG